MKILLDNSHSTIRGNSYDCVFSHYDPTGRVQDYVLTYLDELKNCGFSVVFVTTSPSIDYESLEKLKDRVATAIIRNNIGYDFGSYKTGIELLLSRQKPKRLLLTNDSVFGPMLSLQQIINNASRHDLYGITDSYDHHYHIQSYFLLYGSRVLDSPVFQAFWEKVELIENTQPDFKKKIILDYEVGGSQHFLDAGFSLGVEFEFTQLAQTVFNEYLADFKRSRHSKNTISPPFQLNFNSTHRYWKQLIKLGCPFLKRELLLFNPSNVDISDWPEIITSLTNYDIKHILRALRNFSGNDDFFYLTTPIDVASNLDESGQITLSIPESLMPYRGIFGTPEFRSFQFNENQYLNLYPDVNVAVMKGVAKSGLSHFKQYGATEGRRPCLARTTF